MADEGNLPFLSVKARPYTIPDDLARELAAIVIEWGGLENAITSDLESMRIYPNVRALSDAVPNGFSARLKLWRKSIAALYPTVKSYNDVAEDTVNKARTVANMRHSLIHGLWQPNEENPAEFYVLTILDWISSPRGPASTDRIRKNGVQIKVDAALLAAVHDDIKKTAAHIWGFHISRQLHVFGGLLEAQPESSGERPAPPNPPIPEKP